MPNAPPFTVSSSRYAQYTIPLTADWAGTIRGDYYWQDYSWARIFNDNPYDRIRGYTNVNLTLIFTNQNGWQVMLYDKNVFNETAITGDFLNSDDSGLTTNVFLTDPRQIGIPRHEELVRGIHNERIDKHGAIKVVSAGACWQVHRLWHCWHRPMYRAQHVQRMTQIVQHSGSNSAGQLEGLSENDENLSLCASLSPIRCLSPAGRSEAHSTITFRARLALHSSRRG